jgi:hypothetical protein
MAPRKGGAIFVIGERSRDKLNECRVGCVMFFSFVLDKDGAI